MSAMLAGWCVVIPGLLIGWPATTPADTAEAIAAWNPNVLSSAESMGSMLRTDVRTRLAEANHRDTRAWRAVESRTDWEQLRDRRLAALKDSLGRFPPESHSELRARTIAIIEGDDYRVENITFESRPGLLVTANLYVPAEPSKSMPGVLICHSHHNPKTQGELQDMGVTWARQGCVVLVMDQLGHGERRQHPFRTIDDYAGDFQPGRQDYYFRYNVGLQLHVVGESLLGWMVWDLMRGVDLLRSRPGVDRERIILLGAVAGGGDPAAVAAALDPRIAAVVPFNFGGPQPETRYPLPDDAEESFNYAGSGSWESTRNLRLSARDGFLPWVIVGSMAPRGLIYAHEFSWDRERDPVWRRLQTIYSFYGAAERLSFAHGFGRLADRPPAASHCNNIGPPHRQLIDPALKRWFEIPVPEREAGERRPAGELLCLTGADQPSSTPVYRLADQLAEGQLRDMQRRLDDRPLPERRHVLRTAWANSLGDIEPDVIRRDELRKAEMLAGVLLERRLLFVERDIRLPLVLLIPARRENARLPLVVAVAQGGKAGFLKHRAQTLAALLDAGVAICLPDLRGTGETRPGDDRGRRSEATAVSATELMLGQTLSGARLKDLRSVLQYVRQRSEFDRRRIAVWGESFAAVNPPEQDVRVPLDVDQPELAEPLGPFLALLAGLFEEELAAVASRGGLISFRSILASEFVHVPHDAIIPGAVAAGDLPLLATAISGRRLYLGSLVDGLNRRVPAEIASTTYAARGRLPEVSVLDDNARDERRLVTWLLDRLHE